ncbi:MAG: amidase [Candidatus Eremiobacteraeota bacterium]|nr:amidase [Candidatus Eremiobacteraeota bacterium]
MIVAAAPPSVAEALRRIGVDGDPLQAWTFVDAAAADAPAADGPLSGMPFGVKDIIDVRAMPIACGLARTPRVSEFDAWCVAVLRAAGAVPVGKTHTTPCAHRDPAPTYNPLDAERTPGGSSAGSAAAVAAGHVPFALGTQTIGSVLRPAAYCGVVGFKPSYGRIPTTGVAPFAPSLDHVGIIALDVATAERVARCAISGLDQMPPRGSFRLAVADAVWSEERAPQTREAVRRALDVLRQHGIAGVPRPMPVEVAASLKDAHLVNAFEAHAVLAPLLAGELPPELALLLRRGAAIERDEYAAALARREAARPRIDAFLAGYDAVIVPCADAAPPRATTGDGSPFGPWSYFGTPAISIPIPGTRPAALSLQAVAPNGHDAGLLAAAAAIETVLAGA